MSRPGVEGVRDAETLPPPARSAVCDGSGWIVDDDDIARAVRLPRAPDRPGAHAGRAHGAADRSTRASASTARRSPTWRATRRRGRSSRGRGPTSTTIDDNIAEGRGLWLEGDVGTGKTTLAMLVSQEGDRGRPLGRDLLAAAPAGADPPHLRRRRGRALLPRVLPPPDLGRPAAHRRPRRREAQRLGARAALRDRRRALRRPTARSSSPRTSRTAARGADRRADGLPAGGDVRDAADVRRRSPLRRLKRLPA